jgi:hypothetical protein
MNVTVTRMTFEQNSIARVLRKKAIKASILRDGILTRIENLSSADKDKLTGYLEEIGKTWAEL